MENISTVIIAIVLAVILGLVIFFMIRNKRKGKSFCSCGCRGCAAKEICCKTKDNK